MKTFTKKILAVIVLLVLSITLLPMNAMATEISGDFVYELDDDGNATIIDYRGSGGDVTIPAKLDDHPVTAIRYSAFYSNKSITSVIFEVDIDSIGRSAFQYCDGLKYVTFEGNVGTIGENAFYYCEGLTTVTFQGNVGTIGEAAFYECEGLTTVTFQGNVGTIGDSAFQCCEGLTTVTFQGNVGTIGEDAFYYCPALKDIYFNGTEAEWNAVTKGDTWNAGCPDDMEIHFLKGTYPLWVGGVQVTGANAGNITGDGITVTGGGYVKYKASTKTLTINNAKITGAVDEGGGISSNIYFADASSNLTLELISVNYLQNEKDIEYGVHSAGNLTVTGNGSLNIQSTHTGIRANGNLTIGGTLSLICAKSVDYGLYAGNGESGNGDITLGKEISIKMDGSGYGIYATGKITLPKARTEIETVGGTAIYTPNKGENDIVIPEGYGISTPEDGEVKVIEDPAEDAMYEDYYTIVDPKSPNVASPKVIIEPYIEVKFINADADHTVLATAKGFVGKNPEYTGGTPSLPDTDAARYTFDGWAYGEATYSTDDLPTITEDMTGPITFTAAYLVETRQYDVTFYDEDGKTVLLETQTYDYGTKKEDIVTPTAPTKQDDGQYTYEFEGWNPELADVTGDTNYTAKYKKIPKEFSIKFLNDDGTELQNTKVAYGTKPEYKGERPTKAADAQYTYTFDKWTPEIVSVTGEATYTATYTKTVNEYNLTFDLGGGTLNGQTGKITMTCEYGSKINLPDAPTKEGFKFLYWKGSQYEAGAEYTVEGAHAFTAEWEEVPKEQDTSPKTGDHNDVGLWAAIACGALLAVILLITAGKKYLKKQR